MLYIIGHFHCQKKMIKRTHMGCIDQKLAFKHQTWTDQANRKNLYWLVECRHLGASWSMSLLFFPKATINPSLVHDLSTCFPSNILDVRRFSVWFSIWFSICFPMIFQLSYDFPYVFPCFSARTSPQQWDCSFLVHFLTAASDLFFTAVSEWCFCVAGAAFQGLIACGGKTAMTIFGSLVAVKICRLWR